MRYSAAVSTPMFSSFAQNVEELFHYARLLKMFDYAKRPSAPRAAVSIDLRCVNVAGSAFTQKLIKRWVILLTLKVRSFHTPSSFASIGGVLWADLIGEARIGMLADVERDGPVWTVYIVRE